ncbi:Mg2+ transporter [Staphylococcus warneri]|nr:Mg2+ transporter [Staphylococcus warneri]
MSNDTELKEKENVNEDVYDKDLLDQLLQDGDIDAFREEFLSMHNYEQSEYFEDTMKKNGKRYSNSYLLVKLLISSTI